MNENFEGSHQLPILTKILVDFVLSLEWMNFWLVEVGRPTVNEILLDCSLSYIDECFWFLVGNLWCTKYLLIS